MTQLEALQKKFINLRFGTFIQRQIVKDFLIKFTKKPQKSARSRF